VSSDYVTDVAYVRSFDKDLSPSSLRLVAALNGFSTPRSSSFDYCELGCGHGDTTVVLAAANPDARFVGVDLNPEHLAVANRLAREGGVDNVRFLERDFEHLRSETLPELDFVCAHGVLSWVGPEKRKAMLAFASAKLKPGGLFYASYNAMPGWASVEPLRQLLLSQAGEGAADSLERARLGLAFAKKMYEGGAEYFAANPAAKEMLATMEAEGLQYIAHEYLNAHWAPMYFARVAWEMAACDLHFVGQLPLYLNYRDLSVPAKLAPLFGSVADRLTFESLKDFALNAFFRRDVYIKGRPGRSAMAADAYLDSTAFGLPVDPPLRRDVRLPHTTLRIEGPVFDGLFEVLARGAATGSDLIAHPSLAAFGADQVRASLLRAVLAGHIAPFLRATRGSAAPAEDARLLLSSEYNRAVLQRTPSNDSPLVLASPVSGTGVSIALLRAVALRVLTEVPVPSAREEWIRGHLGKLAARLSVGGRPIAREQQHEQVRLVLAEVEAFRKNGLGKLIELGILADPSQPARSA
jgi:ubiquinone/menaquinone biosynthesis C-methylase UbiE